VKLGPDEAGLALHEVGIVLPGVEKGLLVGFVEGEDIDEHDGGGIDS